MSPAELHKRVAEVLGVSASQKNLAFDVLLESVSDILTEGITLKIPRIGFFQLKTDSLKNNLKKQLMYSSLPEDFDPSEKILYHTFEVGTKYKNPSEIEAQVFSIGVGKPLLPLHDEESPHDSETSFVMLRKSIEERVREILAESDQIPNFNIWEDIYSNSDEETNLDEDISSRLLDLTKDLHFEEESKPAEPEIEPQHQNFLNSLLFSEKPEASDEFFAEEKKEEFNLVEDYKEQQFVLDDSYKFDEKLPEENLTVTDLLSDMDWMKKNDLEDNPKIESLEKKQFDDDEELINTDEKYEISIPESFSEPTKFDIEEESLPNSIDEQIFEKGEYVSRTQTEFANNDIEAKSEEEPEIDYASIGNGDLIDANGGEVLRSLLNDEEPLEPADEDYEITIEPPTSAKELLITQTEELTTADKSAWAIAEEDLKGIINNELKEYDHEKIASDNSRVLNDLLEDAFHRKVDMDSTEEFEEEISEEEFPQQSVSSEKIEWSWGDELKEEFGIGQEEEMTEILPENPMAFLVEDEFQSEPEGFKFDLEKTRQDLFSRLEKTLEKEVTSLHENYDISFKDHHEPQLEKYNEPELKNEFRKTKTQVEETESVVEFKDEKVILDFKTPPPRYEFIEENQSQSIQQDFPDEPVLTKPKRMTILLERSQLEEEVTSRIIEPAENNYLEQTEPQKKQNVFGKLFVLTLTAFIVVTSIAIYLYIRSLSGENKQENSPSAQIEKNELPANSNSNSTVQNTRESLGLNPDDFSEFPTTATPPEPIKEGNTVDVSKLLEKKNDTSAPKNEEIVRQAQQEDLKKKAFAASTNKPAGETRLTDMVFFDGKSYNFQISSWKNKMLAQSEVDRLRSLGFNAFLVEAYLPDKGGTWYRIRIGSFKTEQEALDFKKKNSF